MIGGIILALIPFIISRQTNTARKIAEAIFILSIVYPVLILLIYLTRKFLGESYSYLILGMIVGFLIGIVTFFLFIGWAFLSIRELLHRREQIHKT